MTDSENIVKQVRNSGNSIVVDVTGEVDLQRSGELRTVLMAQIASKPEKLIVNLEQVSYMDSSGVATLVEALQRVRRGKGKLVLIKLTPRVLNVFEIARLDTIFTIHDSEQEALEA